MPAILSAADITGADAIHPGVGFLSENATFAAMVKDHGVSFIGPDPEHIQIMGDKITAKKTMKGLNVPTIPGSTDLILQEEEALKAADSIGYPVLIKATAGGGGRGMKVAYTKEELLTSYHLAKREAKACFGNDQVYMERYLKKPRHIEVQVLCDHFGNVLHLGERDCSLQRRNQKIFEEAQSPGLTQELRCQLFDTVVRSMKEMGYKGVGTLEFLYEDGAFFFMEMNTRIQVEHPISELITKIDLIQEQIRVASNIPLSIRQEDIKFCGHAIECRINAEDPKTFMPSPGTITKYHSPGGPWIRVDSHLYVHYKVPPYYDSLIGKLIAFGQTREEALAHLRRAITEFVIEGISTTLPLHLWLCEQEDIKQGNYDIHWLENNLEKF
jgi:acetyl-CoA carboxylase biotin carboxylase subunit